MKYEIDEVIIKKVFNETIYFELKYSTKGWFSSYQYYTKKMFCDYINNNNLILFEPKDLNTGKTVGNYNFNDAIQAMVLYKLDDFNKKT